MKLNTNRATLFLIYAVMTVVAFFAGAVSVIVGIPSVRGEIEKSNSGPASLVRAKANDEGNERVDFNPTDLVRAKVEKKYRNAGNFFIEWGSESPTLVYFQGTFKHRGKRYQFYGTCRPFNTGWRIWRFSILSAS